jgi:hypothetical protein
MISRGTCILAFVWLAPRPPFPHSPVSKLSLFFCLLVCRCPSSLTREVGRDWGGAKSYDREKAWSSINHWILSELGLNINLCDVTGANAHHGEGTLTSDSAAVLLERGTRPFLPAGSTATESRPVPPMADHMGYTGKGGRASSPNDNGHSLKSYLEFWGKSPAYDIGLNIFLISFRQRDSCLIN